MQLHSSFRGRRFVDAHTHAVEQGLVCRSSFVRLSRLTQSCPHRGTGKTVGNSIRERALKKSAHVQASRMETGFEGSETFRVKHCGVRLAKRCRQNRTFHLSLPGRQYFLVSADKNRAAGFIILFSIIISKMAQSLPDDSKTINSYVVVI